MDLIRIDDNKMKIMLTPVDMQCYDLDAKAWDYNKTETRRAFRSILDDVRTQTGFDAHGNKLYVQLYPSREGGCEMFVTRLDVVCALGESAERRALSMGHTTPALQGRPQQSQEHERRRAIAFVFDALEHLLCVCRRLHAQDFRGGSAAYRGEEGRYYLLLTERLGEGSLERATRGGLLDRRSLSFISEYGIQQNADTVRLYIREHGCPICERDAVGQLADL